MRWITIGYVLLGLGLFALGVPLASGRVPPNSTYGFRTQKTLASPEVWYAANRVQGIDMCVAGIAVVIASVVAYLLLRSGSPARLALVDSSIVVAVLTLVAVHGFLVLGRL